MAFFRRLPLRPPQLAPVFKPTPEELKSGKLPSNAILWSEEAFHALQRFLQDIFSTQEGGLPAGQFTGVPASVEAGVAGLPGVSETGWATGSHKHPIETGIAAILTPVSTSIEGSGVDLARASHTHDMKKVMADVLAKCYLRF